MPPRAGQPQKHPTKIKWGSRRGRPWTDDDVTCAQFLRHCGLADADIGEVLNRSAASVTGKIGYFTDMPYFKSHEAARPLAAKELGNHADLVWLATAQSVGMA